MSQDDLCHEAGLSKNQVGLMERGEINISICTLKRIAIALDVTPSDLLNF